MTETETNPNPAEPQTFSHEYVKELRSEAKQFRLKAAEHETARAAAEASASKAHQDADAKIADATKRAEDRVILAELRAHAAKAGIHDLAAVKILDIESLKIDANGNVLGAEALIEGAKKDKAYLFGTASTSSTAVPPKPAAPTQKRATDLSKDEWRAARAKIKSGADI